VTAPDIERLSMVVRQAASTLVADLERAWQLTRKWANASMTEALVDAAMSACLDTLSRTGCVGEANRLPSGELWQIAGSLLEVGRLQWQARFKPRGYAGDYQLLDWICGHQLCDHPLGRAFDLFFQRQAAPQAVRARTHAVAVALLSERLRRDACDPYHVASVGSGPAEDLRQALSLLPDSHRRTLQVILLDLDPESLDFAQQRIKPLLAPGALTAVRDNPARLPSKPKAAQLLAQTDFLVCTGLFDYLDEKAAVAMLRLFWRQLAAGGQLLVGNFAPSNPTRAYMEWIGNWYLIYRTAEQMIQLAAQAKIPSSSLRVSSEPLGIDLFLIGRKTA